jgi:SAM-dependent methyltransferase
VSVPVLTDRSALLLHRARARRLGLADFLHRLAATDVQERLTEVNRTFTDGVVVTGFPQAWEGVVPGARMVPDDDVLALEPRAHDLVVHAMGLHWANDPVGQLIQCCRALRPDGLLLAVAFGGRTLSELREVLAQAEAEVTGGLSPRVAPMAEIRDLGGLLQRAGLALPVADSTALRVRYRDMDALMRDLRAMGETSALAARPRHFARRAVFARAAALYARHHADGDGIAATFELIFLSGWAPAPGQQQPLRPGSAMARLSDALGGMTQGGDDG